MSPWNPDQYERFRAERAQPFYDLASMLTPSPGGSVIDLGCGTGELTRFLHERSGAATTVGLDSSQEMLEKSSKHAGGGLTFEHGDIATFEAKAKYDIAFSNAALHWIPDHERLYRRIRAALKPGGQLAVQMPANHDHASHTVAKQLASEAPFAAALSGYAGNRYLLAAERYAELLDALSFTKQRVTLVVYTHHLDASSDVVEWTKGSTLIGYKDRLDKSTYEAFEEVYRRRLLELLGDRRPYFFTFKRLLMWGQLGA